MEETNKQIGQLDFYSFSILFLCDFVIIFSAAKSNRSETWRNPLKLVGNGFDSGITLILWCLTLLICFHFNFVKSSRIGSCPSIWWIVCWPLYECAPTSNRWESGLSSLPTHYQNTNTPEPRNIPFRPCESEYIRGTSSHSIAWTSERESERWEREWTYKEKIGNDKICGTYEYILDASAYHPSTHTARTHTHKAIHTPHNPLQPYSVLSCTRNHVQYIYVRTVIYVRACIT